MLTYEQATFQDAPQLVDMRILYIKSDSGDLSPAQEWAMREQLPKYLHQHLERDLFVFTAKEDGTMVAAAWLVVIEKPASPHFLHGRVGSVMSVYTREGYRRRGIAEKLMEALLRFAKEQGLDHVELKATKCGYPLYKKLGFTESLSEYMPMQYEL